MFQGYAVSILKHMDNTYDVIDPVSARWHCPDNRMLGAVLKDYIAKKLKATAKNTHGKYVSTLHEMEKDPRTFEAYVCGTRKNPLPLNIQK